MAFTNKERRQSVQYKCTAQGHVSTRNVSEWHTNSLRCWYL